MKPEDYCRLDLRNDWRMFAKAMFEIQDADPGYMLLHRAKLPYAQKLRYVLAWCTYYNPGIAAVASEFQGPSFYQYLRSQYDTAKRASERRHFRGQAGLKALADWEMFGRPESMVEACFGNTYHQVRRNMKDMTQMGDYFYWKLADIQDTVFGKYVDFTNAEKYMPKVPKEGAALIEDLEWDRWVAGRTEDVPGSLLNTMSMITKNICQYTHPFQDRKLALQEAETVCCVFKQHQTKYQLGFRTAKAVARLESMQSQAPRTVRALLNGMWDGGIWTPENVKKVQIP